MVVIYVRVLGLSNHQPSSYPHYVWLYSLLQHLHGHVHCSGSLDHLGTFDFYIICGAFFSLFRVSRGSDVLIHLGVHHLDVIITGVMASHGISPPYDVLVRSFVHSVTALVHIFNRRELAACHSQSHCRFNSNNDDKATQLPSNMHSSTAQIFFSLPLTLAACVISFWATNKFNCLDVCVQISLARCFWYNLWCSSTGKRRLIFSLKYMTWVVQYPSSK